jgi:hypothetical protein
MIVSAIFAAWESSRMIVSAIIKDELFQWKMGGARLAS